MKYSGHEKWDVRIAFILFDCSHIPLLSPLVILPRGYFITRPVFGRRQTQVEVPINHCKVFTCLESPVAVKKKKIVLQLVDT